MGINVEWSANSGSVQLTHTPREVIPKHCPQGLPLELLLALDIYMLRNVTHDNNYLLTSAAHIIACDYNYDIFTYLTTHINVAF